MAKRLTGTTHKLKMQLLETIGAYVKETMREKNESIAQVTRHLGLASKDQLFRLVHPKRRRPDGTSYPIVSQIDVICSAMEYSHLNWNELGHTFDAIDPQSKGWAHIAYAISQTEIPPGHRNLISEICHTLYTHPELAKAFRADLSSLTADE